MKSEAPPIVHEVLSSPGQPMDTKTRTFMESRFGHDFSGVRVHKDAKAGESARSINAQAYTVGHDIVFGAEQYAPHASAGQKLMAHELAHTVQQSTTSKSLFGHVALYDKTPLGHSPESRADKMVSNVIENTPSYQICAEAQSSLLQRQPFGSPGVQVRSPVFEETVTQLSDVAGATAGRLLNAGEHTLVQSVFGHSIDYDRIHLVPLNALEFRTVGNNVYIPKGFSIADEMMAQKLIHELTHVWQYQHGGTSYISISLGTQIKASIRHGNRNFAYDYQISVGQSFFDFTPEQQGFLVENYFAMKRDRSAVAQDIAAGTSRAYESNHLDSTGFKARLSAAGRQNEIKGELLLHEPLIQQMRTALPQSEASILTQRASEIMTIPEQERSFVTKERQLTPIRPLLEVRF
jgi:hypothetical protein